MKNLMSRDEYLQGVQEGFIKDTIKKGWEKVKKIFQIGMRKIKGLITVFDNEGHILPVITPQAVIDRFSGSKVVEVYASSALSESVVDAGGKGCDEKALVVDSGEIYNDGPDGEEYFDWLENGGFKSTNEYKNFMTLAGVLNESKSTDGLTPVDESWEGIKRDRAKYTYDPELKGTKGVKNISVNQLKDIISEMIDERIDGNFDPDDEGTNMYKNILVFGAPGIGKSTIPSTIVKEYNEKVSGDPSKMIGLIKINCGQLKAGDVVMPTMPKEINVIKEIERFSKTFKDANKVLHELDDEDQEKIADTIRMSGQFKSSDAPKNWLPSYHRIGGEVDRYLNDYANSYVFTDKQNISHKTGNGGIIVFDELLRTDPDVFGDLMNFLLDRELNGWVLGDKWIIIACTNRPSDDSDVREVWEEWKANPPKKARFERWFQLIPSKEQWLEWAEKKKADPVLLDFIFDDADSIEVPEAGDNVKEYPRWHSGVANGADDSSQDMSIDPRRWEDVFSGINKLIKRLNKDIENEDDKIKDVTRIPKDILKDKLNEYFDGDFVAEIMSWLDKNGEKVDLEAIIADPKKVPLPRRFETDPERAVVLIENLKKSFIAKYKHNMDELTDDDFANVIAWLGMRFPRNMYHIQNFMNGVQEALGMDDPRSKYPFAKYIKSIMTLFAAYPEKDIENDVKESEEADEYAWPKGSFDTVKKIMKKYFPWRISGDKINYYTNLDLGEEDK